MSSLCGTLLILPTAAESRDLSPVETCVEHVISPAVGGRVPSPFTIDSSGDRVALFDPSSEEVLLYRGGTLVARLGEASPHRPNVDVAIAGRLVVVGGPRHDARSSASMDVYEIDLPEPSEEGTPPVLEPTQRLRTANPHLRCTPQDLAQWRLVVDVGEVGVYHPEQGATFPLWHEEDGMMASRSQVVRAKVGVERQGDVSWIPTPDQALEVSHRGRTREVAGKASGVFIGATRDRAYLWTNAPANQDTTSLVELPEKLRVIEVARSGEKEAEWHLSTRVGDASLPASCVGVPLRVRGESIYWLARRQDAVLVQRALLPRESP